MLVSEFAYHLPEDLIAQQPLADRAASRMLVVYRREGRWEDRQFRDFPAFLRSGDCLILNDSRVFPSRLYGSRSSGSRVEVFLLRETGPLTWQALVRPGRKVPVGEELDFDGRLRAVAIARGEHGERTLRFFAHEDFWEVLDKIGHVPLPPYIRRTDTAADRERYQTVFARETGSVAAPTAGLHFTPDMLDDCRVAGAATAWITLHVGLGTFQPLHVDKVEDVRLHSESYEIRPEAWERIQAAQRRIAVGTTSVRALESGGSGGETNVFISPGYRFRYTDALLTNFHLPKSSLLMLVCAFAGKDLTLAAYDHAVRERYRFFSYGDCMLIL